MTLLKILSLSALTAGITLPTASFADDDLRQLIIRGLGGSPIYYILRDDDDDDGGRRFVHGRRDHRDVFRDGGRGYVRDDDDDHGRRRGLHPDGCIQCTLYIGKSLIFIILHRDFSDFCDPLRPRNFCSNSV